MAARLAAIVGHERALGALRRALREDRLSHALLFHGPSGVGKRTVALALASALECPERAAAGDDACGECASCSRVQRGLHPDVVYVTLDKTVISIDAVRRVRQEAAYRPFEGRRRVFIVDPADLLSADAQNALLKTLEEPASSSTLILVTQRPMRLLPTIRSRCLSLAFGALKPERVAEELVRAHGVPAERAHRAARLSGGRFGAALALDLEALDAARAGLLEVLSRLAEPRSRDHVLEDAERIGAAPEAIAGRLNLLGELVRDMMLIDAGARGDLIHLDAIERLERLAGGFSGRLIEAADRVRLALSDLERNVNKKVLLETLLFDLARPPRAA